MIAQFKNNIKRYNIKQNSFETLFIGGGTPSTINTNLYEKLFKYIKPYLKDNIEITSEANPNSATIDWLKGLYNLGINRFSFGVQSFDNQKLKYLGRNHNKVNAIKAIENSSNIGIKNISLDLIYNTVKDTQRLIDIDLNIALNLPINHISLYSLTIEEKTKFHNINEKNHDNLDLTKFIFDKTSSKLPQYEISNFGTYKSKHNLGYWQYKEYLGIGCGAVGHINKQRLYTNNNLKEYILNPTKLNIENISHSDELFEKIFLGFRSCVGVDIINILNKDKLKHLIESQKVYLKDNKVYNNNFLLADELALYLIS
jgi:oxygen-independent coproporphyrinogen-3 oxidase